MALFRRRFGEPGDLGLLAGRRVVMASRRGETPEAAADWLDWHRRSCAASGALIHLPDGCEDVARFQTALTRLARDLPIVLVEGGRGVGVPERLRRAYLAKAEAVLSLGLCDLVFGEGGASPFERAIKLNGAVLELRGMPVFPWRLRQGKPARHGDHVAVRSGQEARLIGWCAAPQSCPDAAVWHLGHIEGMPVADDPPMPFIRAMGVARPGVPVGQLVPKGELIEDPDLVRRLAGGFGERPSTRQTRGAAPGDRVTIVTAMKNEGPFILDWIAHHRACGVERFLVYTNECSDGTEGLLDALSEAGVVRRDNPYRETGGVPQHAAFRAAAEEPLVTEAGWLLTLDVDEYLNIHVGDGRVCDLLGAVETPGAISMPWRLFGNADRHRFEDRPVTEQFPLAAADYAPRPMQAWAFKTLYRNDGAFDRLGVHRPKGLSPGRAGSLVWVDGSGRPFPERLWQSGWRMTLDTWGYDLVAVNHYAVRSAESFLVKRDRGRVNHVTSEQGTAYWFRMNHNVMEETSIRRLDARVAAERDRLRRLPGVTEAHEAAVAWHRARIETLKRKPDFAALYAEITGPRLEKLSRMTPNFGAHVFYRGPDVIPDAIVARDPGKSFYFTV